MKKYEFYVSKDSDLKTIEQAQEKVREIKFGDVVVYISGECFLNKTVKFGVLDGGNENKKVTYKSDPKNPAKFTSAVQITDWEKLDEKIYFAKIPENVNKVLTLFQGEKPLTRCHSQFFLPTKTFEYHKLDSLNVELEEERHLLKRVDFPKGMIKNRDNIEDIELRFMPVPWTMNLISLESVDEKDCVAWLSTEATAPVFAKPDGIRVENDIMYLKNEGEWCVNHKERIIYYIPKNGDIEDIFTPTLQEFFLVEGEIRYDELLDVPVKNLHFEGLEFCYGKRDTTEKDYKGGGIQHDWEMFDKGTSLVRFRGAKNCSFKNSYIHSTSGTALRLDLTCENIIVENNLIDNIGNMGILLCGYGPGLKNTNKNNIISNNIITRCGQEIWHGHAIFVWQSGENLIEHNKIHHCARKGIGLCGVRITILKNPIHKFDEAVKTIRWNEIESTLTQCEDEYRQYLPYLHCRDNIVRYNEIYEVLEKIGDGSALNISGAGDGNLVEKNYIHHISTYHASSVLRCDDWQCGTTFKENIIYKSNISGITRKNLNHIIGNYIVDVNCKNGYIRFASYPNEKPNYGSFITNNICYDSGDEMEVFGKGYLVSPGASLPQHCIIENNLVHIGQNNIFKDFENGDFTLLENSKAKEMGIKQIDFENIGLTKEFPKILLNKEYIGQISENFARGKDETASQYNWW